MVERGEMLVTCGPLHGYSGRLLLMASEQTTDPTEREEPSSAGDQTSGTMHLYASGWIGAVNDYTLSFAVDQGL